MCECVHFRSHLPHEIQLYIDDSQKTASTADETHTNMPITRSDGDERDDLESYSTATYTR